MIRLILLVFAIVIFVLVAFSVIDQEIVRWEAGAFAAAFASFLPFSEGVAYVRERQVRE